MKTCSDCKCEFDEGENKHATRCICCELRFNTACDRCRVMRNSVKDKSYKERIDAINNFRAGY